MALLLFTVFCTIIGGYWACIAAAQAQGRMQLQALALAHNYLSKNSDISEYDPSNQFQISVQSQPLESHDGAVRPMLTIVAVDWHDNQGNPQTVLVKAVTMQVIA